MQISWAATFGVCERVHANKWRGYTFLYTWLENDKKKNQTKKKKPKTTAELHTFQLNPKANVW